MKLKRYLKSKFNQNKFRKKIIILIIKKKFRIKFELK